MYHPLTTGPRFLEVAGVGGVTWFAALFFFHVNGKTVYFLNIHGNVN